MLSYSENKNVPNLLENGENHYNNVNIHELFNQGYLLLLDIERIDYYSYISLKNIY